MKTIEITFPEPYDKIMSEWLEYKKSIKHPYKNEMSVRKCYQNLLKMSNNDPVIAQEIVDQSIGNGWIGLFPLRNKNYSTNNNSSDVDTVLEYMLTKEDIKDDMRKEAYKVKYNYVASKLLKIARSVDFAKQAIDIYPKLPKCPQTWDLWTLVRDFDFVLTYLEQQKKKETDKNYTLSNMVMEEKYGK